MRKRSSPLSPTPSSSMCEWLPRGNVIGDNHQGFSPYSLWTHHDNRFLYMLLEYVLGGELFTYLRTAHRFDNPTAVFFACEIVMALDYLHSQDIVYRYHSASCAVTAGENSVSVEI